jgi:hypothetical protein
MQTANVERSVGGVFMLIEKRELELEFFLADAVGFVPMDLRVVDCSVQQTNGCESFQLPPFAAPVLPVEPRQIADSGARCDGLSIPDVSYNLEIHGCPEASTPLRVMAQRLAHPAASWLSVAIAPASQPAVGGGALVGRSRYAENSDAAAPQ